MIIDISIYDGLHFFQITAWSQWSLFASGTIVVKPNEMAYFGRQNRTTLTI